MLLVFNSTGECEVATPQRHPLIVCALIPLRLLDAIRRAAPAIARLVIWILDHLFVARRLKSPPASLLIRSNRSKHVTNLGRMRCEFEWAEDG